MSFMQLVRFKLIYYTFKVEMKECPQCKEEMVECHTSEGAYFHCPNCNNVEPWDNRIDV